MRYRSELIWVMFHGLGATTFVSLQLARHPTHQENVELEIHISLQDPRIKKVSQGE